MLPDQNLRLMLCWKKCSHNYLDSRSTITLLNLLWHRPSRQGKIILEAPCLLKLPSKGKNVVLRKKIILVYICKQFSVEKKITALHCFISVILIISKYIAQNSAQKGFVIGAVLQGKHLDRSAFNSTKMILTFDLKNYKYFMYTFNLWKYDFYFIKSLF